MTEQTNPTLVDNMSITSTTEVTYDRLNAGDNISVTAIFSEPVIVTDDDGIGVDNASGTPTLNIVVDTAGDGADVADSRTATYVSGDNSTALVFQYTIQSGDNDTNGISIGANALALNSGTIRDASGNYATITHSVFPDNSSYIVDNTAPILSSVIPTSSTSNSAISQYKIPVDGSHCDGSSSYSTRRCNIYITATWSEHVMETGSPTLSINIDGTIRTASWFQRNGYLRFRYAIREDDPLDTDGISIPANAISLGWDGLNLGTITDLAGNVASSTHNAVGENAAYQVKNW